MRSNLKKCIAVSGAGGGIGFAMVNQLLNQGYHVIAITRNILKFDELLIEFKDRLTVWELDFLSDDLGKKIAEFIRKISHIDVLINNAGLLINKSFVETSPEEIQQLVAVNYTGTLELTKSFIPLLRKSAKGHVVNISTMGAVQGSAKFSGLSVYASSKAAICTFTEVMAEEYKQENIHFNCLALGSVETSMFNKAFPGFQASQSAEKVADFIIDFALNRRDMFNGKIISVAADTP